MKLEKKISQLLKNILFNIKNRRGMYIHDPESFYQILSFITGAFTIICESYEIDIHQNIQNFSYKKYRKNFSLSWGCYIYNILARKDEKVAIKLLFDLLEKFIEEELEKLKA